MGGPVIEPGRVYHRPGSGPRPTAATIAAALRDGPVHLTAGEADELADTLAPLWNPR